MNGTRSPALLAVLGVLVGALFISSASAADSGFYLGIGAGQGKIRDDPASPSGIGTVNFDAEDTSYKLFAGYRLGALPFLDFAFEGGYMDFGKPSQTFSGQRVEYKLHGFDAAGLAIFPLGPIDLYGKLGALSWSSDKTIGGSTASKTGSNAFYGVGVGLRLGALGLRAEYERFDIGDLDRVEMYSLNALIQF
ncbi:MAG TPA: outer membrane beta-barrel protein [Burkholderiales bacterium]|nr:outer membrane beta-barrel protein [Burkholderiales bacterium]